MTLSIFYSKAKQEKPHTHRHTHTHTHFAVQLLSSLILCDHMNYSGPCFLIFPYLPEFAHTHDIELGMPSNHPIFCCLLLLLLSIFSSIRVFPSESLLLIRWPKYQSFSFSVSPSNEYSGLISFKIDWLDHVEVQGIHTLQSKALTKSGITLILVFWMLSFNPTFSLSSFTLI